MFILVQVTSEGCRPYSCCVLVILTMDIPTELLCTDRIRYKSILDGLGHQNDACDPIAGSRPAAIGPAVPPPELLAAAAQIPWEEDEEDVEDLIGPAPPEMAEELDGVGGDERIAEVARVIRSAASCITIACCFGMS